MAKMEERPPPVIDYAKPLFKPCHVPHQRVLSPLPLTPLAQKVRVYTWTSPFGSSFAGHMNPCPFSILRKCAGISTFVNGLFLNPIAWGSKKVWGCVGGGGFIYLHSLGQIFALLRNFVIFLTFCKGKELIHHKQLRIDHYPNFIKIGQIGVLPHFT